MANTEDKQARLYRTVSIPTEQAQNHALDQDWPASLERNQIPLKSLALVEALHTVGHGTRQANRRPEIIADILTPRQPFQQ
jgi:hypothetical protein